MRNGDAEHVILFLSHVRKCMSSFKCLMTGSASYVKGRATCMEMLANAKAESSYPESSPDDSPDEEPPEKKSCVATRRSVVRAALSVTLGKKAQAKPECNAKAWVKTDGRKKMKKGNTSVAYPFSVGTSFDFPFGTADLSVEKRFVGDWDVVLAHAAHGLGVQDDAHWRNPVSHGIVKRCSDSSHRRV